LRFEVGEARLLTSRFPFTALRLLLTVFTACCSPLAAYGALAANEPPVASSSYRLDIDRAAYRLESRDPTAFRLRGPQNEAEPDAEPVRETSSPFAGRPYANLIDAAARAAALDPALVHAVISVESRYDQNARSKKGALGLMQLLPETAARYGIADSGRSAEANLRAGTQYLSDLIRLFDCRLDLALAAYNAGEKTVLRYGLRIPPYPETQAYVPAVLGKFAEWKRPSQPAPPVRSKPQFEYIPGLKLELEQSVAAADASEAPAQDCLGTLNRAR
jgi:soluble lytic murein transglycosylase-like protein